MIKDIEKILSYWQILEILKQDAIPEVKQTKYKNTFATMEQLLPNIDLLTQISNRKDNYQMSYCSNITLYIGSIVRDKCVMQLVSRLEKNIDGNDKKKSDNIAWASMQFDKDGKYIDKSFYLSPLLWGIDTVLNNKNLSGYNDCRKEWNDVINQIRFSVKKTEIDDNENTQVVSYFYPEGIKEVQEKIYERYIKDTFSDGSDVSDRVFISYKIANNPQYIDDDDYHGLSMNFFADEIEMIKQSLNNNSYWRTDMGKALIAYINSPHQKENFQSERINIRFQKDSIYSVEELYSRLFPILTVKYAPQAKWPSKYMPAFMQQVAVNLFTGVDIKPSIFAVNGPPGTGKTTMLKEIVAHNVVERAKLLINYTNADDAFITKDFSYGHIKGANGFNKYCKHFQGGYFVLENDKINNYGILVASCNNAAVENISKELPKVKDIKINKTVHRQKDIYFSKFASDLLGKKDSAWGIIAAALGKKENIRTFADKVLNPLMDSFFRWNTQIEYHKKAFADISQRFSDKLEKVQSMQKKLEQNCQIFAGLFLLKKEIKCSKELLSKHHDEEMQWLQVQADIIRNLGCNNTKFGKIMKERDKYEYDGIIFKKLSNNKHNASVDKKIKDIENEHGSKNFPLSLSGKMFPTSLVGWKKYIDNRMNEIIQSKSDWNNQFEKFHRRKILFWVWENKVYKNFVGEYKASLDNELEILLRERQIVEEIMEKIVTEKNTLESYEQSLEKQEVMARSIKDSGILCFDDEYWERLFSDDDEVSTKAHTDNPWFTDDYNRAREELFWLAMQVHKEFILSSKCCRDNLKNLMLIWDVYKENNNRIEYNISDRRKAMPALLQTLSLLVPVISTTFAAVGRFLRDVQVPGAIGTLIVDEAGQAEPQMALGALYRSRRAIIVGDPKQVEPVVTDELDLLKSTYTEDIYRGYTDKGISVQQFADSINKWGTYLNRDDDDDNREWLGCPLLVHRRCINPMYKISNQISYGGMMKKQTAEPSDEKKKNFLYTESCWFDVAGKEIGNKDHFVEQQGQCIVDMMKRAFQNKPDNPNIYIISPFTSVVNRVTWLLKKELSTVNNIQEWCRDNIGTVHKFQGKEADEVIFVLGCDDSQSARGAVNWVNSNIVNVAVTRAKYRLYVIGARDVWKHSYWVNKMMTIMDEENMV